MIKTCHGCLALSQPNPYGPQFCPLGYEVIRINHAATPAEECPRPKTHADLIAADSRDKEG